MSVMEATAACGSMSVIEVAAAAATAAVPHHPSEGTHRGSEQSRACPSNEATAAPPWSHPAEQGLDQGPAAAAAAVAGGWVDGGG